jgi:hypothetical protein
MGATARIRAYYEALREGDPLVPYFAPDERVVKFGISETLSGYEAIEAGLEEQSRTTTDWRVESRALRVTERDRPAWFSDSVALAWTDTEARIRYEFETRWSGTLEARDDDGQVDEDGTPRFVGMHVSTIVDNDVWKEWGRKYVEVHTKHGLGSPKTPAMSDENMTILLSKGQIAMGKAETEDEE